MRSKAQVSHLTKGTFTQIQRFARTAHRQQPVVGMRLYSLKVEKEEEEHMKLAGARENKSACVGGERKQMKDGVAKRQS